MSYCTGFKILFCLLVTADITCRGKVNLDGISFLLCIYTFKDIRKSFTNNFTNFPQLFSNLKFTIIETSEWFLQRFLEVQQKKKKKIREFNKS